MKMGYVTSPCTPLLEWFVIRGLELATINLFTRRYEDMKGDTYKV